MSTASELLVLTIARVLEKSSLAVTDREKIADFIGTPSSISGQLNTDYRANIITPYSYFEKIVESWISRNGSNATIEAFAAILKTNCYNNEADLLENKMTAEVPQLFEVIKSIAAFVGRVEELRELQSWYNQYSRQSVVLISGIGGIGKTHLCRKFIEENNDATVTWLAAGSFDELTRSITDYADSSGQPTTDNKKKPLPLASIIGNISRKINSAKVQRWIVVLDNVDNKYDEFIPTLNNFLDTETDVFIMVTSTLHNIIPLEEQHLNHLPLDVLNDDAAFLFIEGELKKITEKPTDDDIRELCKVLENFPLALNQATAFIRNKCNKDQAYGVRKFLRSYKDALTYALQFGDYNKRIVAVVKMAVDDISCLNGLILLRILSLVDSNGVENEFLEKRFSRFLVSTSQTSNEYENARDIMIQFSLVKINLGIVSMHHVIQEILREIIFNPTEPGSKEFVGRLIESVEVGLSNKREIQHVRSIWSYARKIEDIVIQKHDLILELIVSLKNLRMYLEATNFAEKNATLFNSVLGPSHRATLEAKHNFANCLSELANYKEAISFYREVIDTRVSVLGPEHPDTLSSKSNLAMCLQKQDNIEEAQRC